MNHHAPSNSTASSARETVQTLHACNGGTPKTHTNRSRREVLLAGAGAAASSLLASGAVLASSRPTEIRSPQPLQVSEKNTTLKKALKYGMISAGTTVREKFEIAREAGFDGIEIDAPGGPNVDEVLKAKEATGLQVPGVVDSVHWSKTLGDPDPEVRAAGVAGLLDAIELCNQYGGSSVLLVPAVVNKNIAYDHAYERSQVEIRKAIPRAKELGVKISFENVWNNFLLSPMEAARYVDAFDSPTVGWHFDIGNIVNYGWPEQWIRILGHRINRLDVKGFSRTKRDNEGLWKGFGVEIGDGDSDWPKIMTALDDIGYTGWIAAEVSGGDVTRLTDVAQRMDRVLAM